MKKVLAILILTFLLPCVFAASYTQTAAEVSPGVFPEDGSFYFPGPVNFGTTDDASVGDYKMYAYASGLGAYGLYAYGEGSGIGLYAKSDENDAIYAVTGSSASSDAAVRGVSSNGAPALYGYESSGDSSGIGVKSYSADGYAFYVSGSPSYGLYVPYSDSVGVYANSDGTGGRFDGDNYGVVAYGDYALYAIGETRGLYVEATEEGSSTTGNCAIAGKSPDGDVSYLGCEDYGIYTNTDIQGDDIYGNSIYADYAELNIAAIGSCSGDCDIAESFQGKDLEPGDVVVLSPQNRHEVLKTDTPYNKLVVGIISTNPTITMGTKDGYPIALSGVVPTKVIGTVHIGDLLTTSSTPGYAMACQDYSKCAGAIIGKAMEENKEGKGKITALVMLG